MTTDTVTQTDLLPEVQEFLSKETHGAVISGEEVMSSDGGTFETHDPGSGQKLATVANLTGEDVKRAVAVAQRAFDESDWAKMPVNERCVYLQRMADEVEKRKAIMALNENLRKKYAKVWTSYEKACQKYEKMKDDLNFK